MLGWWLKKTRKLCVSRCGGIYTVAQWQRAGSLTRGTGSTSGSTTCLPSPFSFQRSVDSGGQIVSLIRHW